MNKKELNLMQEFLYYLGEQSRKITVKGFKTLKKINYKLDGTPVTKFDIQSEKKIRNLISKNFPNHNIVGEENSDVNQSSDYTWLIDPIDGTKSFSIGRPIWGTMIALIYKKTPLIGLVDFPCLNEVWLGDNKSCYLNKKKFKFIKKKQTKLSGSVIASTDPSLFDKNGFKKFKLILKETKFNCWSGDCHNYLLLSNGGLDLIVEENLSSYDIIPLLPILKAQNLCVSDWEGNEINFQINKKNKIQVLASVNSLLHNEVIKLLKEN